MTYILSIDSGLSTGWVLGRYSSVEPWARLAFGQIEGGVNGFLEWWRSEGKLFELGRHPLTSPPRVFGNDGNLKLEQLFVYVLERFTPLHHDGFNLTEDSVEPLRIEGAFMALVGEPVWQRPAEQYWAGGDTLPEKKKAARAWLKEHNLLPTGKDVGLGDANDVVSATLHSLAYMRNIQHMPSLRKWFL